MEENAAVDSITVKGEASIEYDKDSRESGETVGYSSEGVTEGASDLTKVMTEKASDGSIPDKDFGETADRSHHIIEETLLDGKQRKRRPRKSSEPKRILEKAAKLQNIPKTDETEMNNITAEEELDETIDNQYMYILDTDIEESDDLSNEEKGKKTKGKRSEKRKYKYKKKYKPRDHGIDFPESVLVDSPTGEHVEVLCCKLCNKACKNKSSYVAHYKACVDPEAKAKRPSSEKHACETCGRLYETKHSLQRHMKLHIGDEKLMCQVCGRQFTEMKSLQGHIRIHTGEKPFVCSFCGFKFRDKSTWRKHEVRHGTDKPFHCDVCNKDFFHGVDLRKHLKIHSEDREFKCSECDKSYYLVAQLKRHMRTHTGEKPYECQYCGKFYTDQGNLRSHVTTHTGIRPFQCDSCGETFLYKCRLDDHLKRHTNERQYECDVCSKSFFTSSNLSKHKKIHLDKKDLRCVRCDQTFDDDTSLKEHKKNHKPVRTHVCAFCGKAFVTVFVLRRHLTTCKGKKHIEAFDKPIDKSAEGRNDVEDTDDSSSVGSEHLNLGKDKAADIGDSRSKFGVSVGSKYRKRKFPKEDDKQIEVLINEQPDINKTLNNFIGNYAGFVNSFKHDSDL